MPSREIEDFIIRWSAASASERANSQLFLAELCDLLEVPRPDNTFTTLGRAHRHGNGRYSK